MYRTESGSAVTSEDGSRPQVDQAELMDAKGHGWLIIVKQAEFRVIGKLAQQATCASKQ